MGTNKGSCEFVIDTKSVQGTKEGMEKINELFGNIKWSTPVTISDSNVELDLKQYTNQWVDFSKQFAKKPKKNVTTKVSIELWEKFEQVLKQQKKTVLVGIEESILLFLKNNS